VACQLHPCQPSAEADVTLQAFRVTKLCLMWRPNAASESAIHIVAEYCTFVQRECLNLYVQV